MGITVATAGEATDELVAALNRLLPQLTPSVAPFDRATLTQLLAQPGLTLLLAYDEGGQIVGTATLVVFDKLSNRQALLEDVVVDASARGRGIGAALTAEVIRLAGERGARFLDLTSSPRREAANRLYPRLGFGRRETNVYRLDLTP